ncbi:response regulator transcription factor [Hymenobacter ruricola]|uniref:Response regulator transcription factor n=1 Tax=Hymenobacter ruricola TaxID=2791023 RepID=A0ABS0HZY0_9BACT|nr:LuxR C-terminal-related transcriptional regulator [Hymenobacter ruricola]MBF9220248.1 response regulator transcription factor [Hymenobacter ruricola]
MLKLQHAQQLSAALVPLYADPRPDHMLGRLSGAVSEVMGAELTCFDVFDAHGQMLNLGSNSPSLFTPSMVGHLAEHIQAHPLFQGLFIERRPTPLKISDFCPNHRFVKTDIFNDFYRPIAVTHQLVVAFEVPGLGLTTCALSRSHADFTETERALLAFVQPHLIALMQLAFPLALKGLARAAALASTLGLTVREGDILRHLAQGRADKEIAHRCRISPRTVHNHLRSIYAKLGVDNRTAASLRAVAGY